MMLSSNHEIDMRRLDESIRDESQLNAQMKASAQEVERLEKDLDVFAQPVGVVPAVVILAAFSVLGILVPLGFMAFGPTSLSVWAVSALLACFVVGLAAVLIYILWYLHLISHEDSAPSDRVAS